MRMHVLHIDILYEVQNWESKGCLSLFLLFHFFFMVFYYEWIIEQGKTYLSLPRGWWWKVPPFYSRPGLRIIFSLVSIDGLRMDSIWETTWSDLFPNSALIFSTSTKFSRLGSSFIGEILVLSDAFDTTSRSF